MRAVVRLSVRARLGGVRLRKGTGGLAYNGGYVGNEPLEFVLPVSAFGVLVEILRVRSEIVRRVFETGKRGGQSEPHASRGRGRGCGDRVGGIGFASVRFRVMKGWWCNMSVI